jgi:hypothetical protein
MTVWLDPHIYVISRVTDDYHRMAWASPPLRRTR